MRKALLALVILGIYYTCSEQPVQAEPEVIVSKTNVAIIDGPIYGGNVFAIGKEMVVRAQKGVEQFDLIINSPGGEVTTGFLFINLMEEAKRKGMTIRCFVPELAASMAFSILVHCNERYTLSKAFLLWHRARIMFLQVVVTGPALSVLGRDLEKVDETILEGIVDVLGVDRKTVEYHYEHETMHIGSNLAKMAPGFITSHVTIDGLYSAIINPTTMRLPKQLDEDELLMFWSPDDIIYIHQKFLQIGKE